MTKAKKFHAKAPCRVDLAGGTLDLWPLYLYTGGHELVHMSIPLFANATLSVTKPSKNGFYLRVFSEDYNTERVITSKEELLNALRLPTKIEPLRWPLRILSSAIEQHHIKSLHWDLRTQSDVPPGSGLGGSSVLGIAIQRALTKALSGKSSTNEKELWKLQELTRNLEAAEIEHPAGEQDYVPALFDGLLVFHLGASGKSIERLRPATAKRLRSQIQIVYTGQPHHSGINNWQIFKAFHDGHKETRNALGLIHDVSKKMAAELRLNRFSNMATLLNQEWAARKELSSSVDAPVLQEAAKWGAKLGATAWKACGAGGGGCLMLYFEDAKTSQQCAKAPLPSNHWKILPSV